MRWEWLIVGALSCVALGVLLGFGIRSDNASSGPGRLWSLFVRASPAVVVFGGAVAIVWGLVLAAIEDRVEAPANEAWWAQGIAAVALLLGTLLLYATGRPAYTVVREIKDGDVVKYRVGHAFSKPDYDSLAAEQQASVRVQRGLYFRALFVGDDGRWSTSKVQALLWTYTLLYALIALFVAAKLGLDLDSTEMGRQTFGEIDLNEKYLLLLGGPFAAAVLAKGIMGPKVENGDVIKPDVPTERTVVTGLRDVISDDEGRTDLVDFQYLAFNVVALLVFFVNFVPGLDEGLPEIPEFLVGLTSASALAYVTKKAVDRAVPQIIRVVPARAFPGQTVRIHGRFLFSDEVQRPSVSIAKRLADVAGVDATRGDFRWVDAVVPQDAEVGQQEVAVIPAGATAPATEMIEILTSGIATVEPKPIPALVGTKITVQGGGFARTAGAVELAGQQLEVLSWSEDEITASLLAAPPTGSSRIDDKLPLRVRGTRGGPDDSLTMLIDVDR